MRRRDDIRINIAVMISSPLRENERRLHNTEAWPKILTIKCCEAKEDEGAAEATMDCKDSIHYFSPSLTVSLLKSTLLVVIDVVVLLFLVLVSGNHRSRLS